MRRYLIYNSRFAYTKEEIHKYIQELVEGKKDPIGAMGYDAPVHVEQATQNHYLITLNSCLHKLRYTTN
ncbi:glutamate synthase central domain-containing protein [Staphylococcus aureus]